MTRRFIKKILQKARFSMNVLSLKVHQQTHCHFVIVLHNVKYHYVMQKYHFIITVNLFVCLQKTLQVSQSFAISHNLFLESASLVCCA